MPWLVLATFIAIRAVGQVGDKVTLWDLVSTSGKSRLWI